MRLHLEYFDQNETFAELLPQNGTVERSILSQDNNRWILFRLDSQIEYDGRVYDHLLLRSRWQGHKIGEPEATSVFICLVDDGRRVADGFNIDDFPLVAWGMATVPGPGTSDPA